MSKYVNENDFLTFVAVKDGVPYYFIGEAFEKTPLTLENLKVHPPAPLERQEGKEGFSYIDPIGKRRIPFNTRDKVRFHERLRGRGNIPFGDYDYGYALPVRFQRFQDGRFKYDSPIVSYVGIKTVEDDFRPSYSIMFIGFLILVLIAMYAMKERSKY